MSTDTVQTLDLKGFLPDLIDLIAGAHDLGWHSTQKAHAGRGHYPTVVLHSPVGGQTIRIEAVRQMNERKMDTLRRKVVTYGDPVRKALVIATHEMPTVDAVAAHLEPVIPNEPPKPTCRQWLAHKAASRGGGTMYESEAVIQRDWPSGETDYACAFTGCDYTSVRPRSVSNHYGQKHTAQGETDPGKQDKVVPVTDYTEPLSHRDYVPSDRLVKALAAYLEAQHLEGEGWESAALWALTWAHERPDLEDVEARPREALTAEQVVERIRMLVGAPLAAVLADRETELAELRRVAVEEAEQHQREVDGLQSSLTDMLGQVTALREERAALRDLLNDTD